ncbi:uncharacterized protein LOC111011789 [Momordica charantia]|uniref:Uncharacterized protein LOC111011789 n=1 Tax=Momordica charantia TaxID=3673 RepID=A0A6J1CIZ9_MOMCH|nr:uncharacterized protein LOC111011789 [Momordica charantia]
MARTGGRSRNGNDSAVVGFLKAVLRFLKMAEFEILFILFFVVAFILFKDLTSRPEYNQILVKKPEGFDMWPFQNS